MPGLCRASTPSCADGEDADGRDKPGHDAYCASRYGPFGADAMLTLAIALTLHLLSAVVWVGGMFAAYLCLRPAAGPLEPPQRLMLWRRFFAKFFPWVWASVVLLLVTGFWMMLTFFGGMSAAPAYIHVMMGLGILMVLIYAWLFHGPWLK